MVAIVSGSSLGVFNSSAATLGSGSNVGPGNPGRNGETVVVNSATGNLVVQDSDETLRALGLNLALVRTYNSQGMVDGDNNDNWRIGVYQRVYGLTGTVNAAGSTITKTFGDGTDVVYTYNGTQYVGADGSGANDTLSFSSSTNQWTWTNGSTRATETYNASGQLLNSKDVDGNTVSYGYTGALLTSITDASNQVTTLTYSGTNLTLIKVTQPAAQGGAVQTLTRYTYDTSNRLTQVTVDLTPADNSIADGKTYVTTYTYEGTSKRLSTITQSDGSSVSFTYQNVNGQYQVKTYTVNDAAGGNRTVVFTYGGNYNATLGVYQTTTATDPLGRTTTYTQDTTSGRLLKVQSPTVSGTALETDYTYDAGKVQTVTQDPTGLNRVTTYQYDSNENLTLTRDAAGNTVSYTYDPANQLVTESTYLVRAGSGQPNTPLTTRYVYDAEEHLRFIVSADGRVTEYRYNPAGQRVMALKYTGATYDLSGLALATVTSAPVLTEAQLQTFVSTQKAQANFLNQIERIDYSYDFRGQVSAATAWSALTAWTATDGTATGTSGTPSITRMIYDQRGLLLQTIDARGTSTPDGVTTTLADSTTYTYDGMGRVLTTAEWLVTQGATQVTRATLVQYDDAGNRTLTTSANGLITTSTYDHAGELTSVVNTGPGSVALGTTTYKYDADNRLLMSTDPTGMTQFFLYDEAGRKTGEVDSNGNVLEFVYDQADELIKTIRYATALTSTTAFVNSSGTPLNPLIAAVRPATTAYDQTTRSIYNSAGQLAYMLDAVGVVTQRIYDGAGRITDQVQYATSLWIPSTVTELRPTATAGQLTDPVASKTYTVTPSANDRHTRFLYNNDGQLVGTLDAAGYLTEHLYDGAGEHVQSIAYATVTAAAQQLAGTLSQLRPAPDTAHDQHTYTFYDDQGRVVGKLDAEGYLTETQYDAAGQVLSTIRYDHIDASGATLGSLTYTAGDTLASLKSRVPVAAVRHTQSFQYDGAGRVIQDTNYEGTVTTYTYDSVDNLVSSTVALGTPDARTTQTRYDALGRVTQALTAEGASKLTSGMTQAQIDAIWTQYSVKYAYDLAGRQISQTDQNNLTTTFYYDNDGQQRFTINAAGEVQENRYNALSQLTDTLVYTNRISTTGLTGGLLTATLTTQLTPAVDSVHDAKTSFIYVANGKVGIRKSAMGALTSFGYDAFGDEMSYAQKIDAAHSLEQDFSYDGRGLLKSAVSDPVGLNISVSTAYDAFGRVVASTDARSNVSTFQYDRLGRAITTTDALNAHRTVTYDAFDRVLTTTDALNTTTKYTYNDTNQSVTVTTPEGVVVSTVHNREGQTLSVTANGNTTNYSYDANGQIKSISDTVGTLESRTYDAAGRELTDTDARGTVTKFTYDAANRVLTRTVDPTTITTANDNPNGLNLQTTYQYDGQGRVTQVTEANGRITRTSYDADGRVTDVAVDPAGLNLRTHYTYDLENRVLTVIEGFGSTTPRTTQYLYDTLGLRTDTYVDPTALGGTLNLHTVYKYDANGNATHSIDANGNSTWFIYDANNRLTDTIDALGEVTELTYDAENRAIATRQYTATVSVASFIDVVTATHPTSSTVSFQSGTTAAVTIATAATDTVTQVVYDKDGRAVYSINGVGDVTELTYNANGQVTRSRAYATPIAVGSYTTVASVQTALTTAGNSLTTLAAGDQLAWSVYDLRGRIAFTIDGVGGVVQYQYDGNGNTTKTIGFATARATTLATDLTSLQSFASSNAGNPQNVVTTLAYDKADRLCISTDGTGVKSFALYDALGRVIATIDGSGTLTEIDYNSLGDVIKTVRYADALPQTTLASLVDGSGNPTTISLATLKAALPTTVGRASDQVTRAVYNSANQLIYTLDASGAITQTLYDTAGRVIGSTQFATRLTIPATVAELRLTATAGQLIDPATSTTYSVTTDTVNDRSTRVIYDNDGHVLATLDAAGYLIEHLYNSAGELTQTIAYATPTTASLRQTGTLTQLRPALDNETTVTPERDSTTYFFYDSQGRAQGTLDGEGYLSELQYNSASQAVQTLRYDRPLTYTAGSSTFATLKAAAAGAVTHTHTVQYDGVGRVQQETDYEGTVTAYTYDGAGKVIGSTRAFGTTDARTAQTRYDALGRVSQALTAEGASKLTSGLTQAQIDAIWAQYSMHYGYDAAGRRISVTDQNSHTTYLYYDSDNRLRFTVNAAGEVQETRYNALGQVTSTLAYTNRISITGLSGGLLTAALTTQLTPVLDAVHDAQTSFTYTVTGQVRTRTTAMGASSSYVYDAFGEAQTVTQKIDATRSLEQDFSYDTRGLVKSVVSDPLGLKIGEATVYDAFGRAKQITDARGNVSKIEYDRLGRVTATVDALNGRRVTTYDAFDRVLTTKDALNNTTTYAYNDATRSMTVTTPEGIQIASVHNREGQSLSVTAAGNTTTYSYDPNGQIKTISDSLGTLDSRAYDAAGRELTDTDARGIVTKFSYDAADRVLTRTVDPTTINTANDNPNGLNLTTIYQYDGQGRVTQVTEPTGRLTQTSYDRDSRVTQVTIDPVGLNLRTQYTYDLENHALTVIEGAGSTTPRTTQYLYDTLGRRTDRYVDPTALGGTLNLHTQYKYDANGNVTHSIDANGSSNWFVYDADNRLVDTVDALGEVTGMTYDAESRVIGTRAYLTAISTASFGDVVTAVTVTATALDRVDQTVYDKDGRAKYSINGVGTVTERTFDANGNVTRSRSYANCIAAGAYTSVAAVQTALTTAGNSTSTVAAADRVNWTVYDLRGRAAFSIDGVGAVCQYQYDGDSNVTATTCFAALRATTLATDLASLQSWATANTNIAKDETTHYWYDSANRLRFTLSAEGYLSESRYNDAARQVNQILYSAKPTLAASATLATVTSAATAIANTAKDENTQSVNDAAGRLSQITDALSFITKFVYDAVGNRIETDQAVDAGGTTWTITRHYFDAANREVFTRTAEGYLTANVYDADSNLKTQTVYDQRVAVPAAGSNPVPVTGDTSHVTAYFYDSANRLYRQTSAFGINTDYTYDAHGNRLTQIEASGTVDARTTKYVYDAADRLYETTQAVGTPIALTTHLDLDAFGNVHIRHEAYGTADERLTQYDYDADNRLVAETDALKIVTQISYDAFGNVHTRTVAFGTSDARTETTNYDRMNRVATVSNAAGNLTAFTYDAAGNRLSLIQAPGAAEQRSNSYSYDLDNRLSTTTDGNGVVTKYLYDARGNKTDTYQAFGRAAEQRHTIYAYDSDNRVLSITDPMGGLTQYQYDVLGNQTKITDANGGIRTSTFDALGRLKTTLSAGGTLIVNTYDNRNNIRSATQSFADGSDARVTNYGYDLLDHQTSITDGEGFTTSITYDEFGNQKSIVHGQYLLTSGQTGYDATKAAHAAAMASSFSYDADDRMKTMTDGMGNITQYGYDNVGNRTTITEASNGLANTAPRLTQYTYDLANRLKTVVTPLFGETTYDYDQVGNKTGEHQIQSGNIYASGAVWIDTKFEYDGDGRLKAQVDPYGIRTEYTYDAMGNLKLTRTAAGTSDERTAGANYDLNNRKTADIDGYNRLVNNYAYDNVGNRIKVTDALGKVAHFYYSADNQLTTILDPEGYINTFKFDSAGNRTEEHVYMTQFTGTVSDTVAPVPAASTQDRVTSLSYDRANQLHSRTEADGVGTVFALTNYTYDGAGDKLQETRFANTTAPRSVTYAYDLDGRIKTFTDVDNAITTYTYDAANNLMSQLIVNFSDPNPARETDYTYDLNNRRLTETFDPNGLNIVKTTGYDAIGNVTSTTINVNPIHRLAGVPFNATTYTYDLDNRLKTTTDGAGDLTQYGYDKAGNRTSLTDPNVNTTNYVYDLNNRQLQEIKPSVTIFTIAGGQTTGRPTTTITYDAVGNAIQVVDPAGFITTSYYDGNHRLVAQLSGDVAVNGNTALCEYTYNGAGQVFIKKEYETRLPNSAHNPAVRPAPPTGVVRQTVYLYDAEGRLTQTFLPAIDVTTLANTSTSTPSSTKATVTLNELTVYDAYGNAVKTVDRAGNITLNYYDVKGNKIASVDPLGYLTQWDYDGQGKQIAQRVYTQALSSAVVAGLNTSILTIPLVPPVPPTPASGSTYGIAELYQTNWYYDTAERLVKEVDPALDAFDTIYVEPSESIMRPTTTYTYDEANNLLTKTVGVGTDQAATEYYYYDSANRRVATVNAARTVYGLGYDANGNATTKSRYYLTLPGSINLSQPGSAIADFLGQQLQLGSNAYAQSESTLYTYDALNRIIKDASVMVPSTGEGAPPTTLDKNYMYDADSNRTYFKDEDGYVTKSNYDAKGHVIQTLTPDSNNSFIDYDIAGNVILIYTGKTTTAPIPANTLAASFGNGNQLSVSWIEPTVNQLSWVVWDTVSHTGMTTYANSTAAQMNASANGSMGATLGDTSSVAVGTAIYFRVVTQDSAGNLAWTDEKFVTVPPRLSTVKVGQPSASSLTVTIHIDGVVSAVTLAYGQPGNLSSSAAFVSQGNGNYIATLTGVTNPAALAYAVRWTDSTAHTYGTAEAKFVVSGDRIVMTAQVSSTPIVNGSLTLYAVNVQATLPAVYTTGASAIVSMQAQWRAYNGTTNTAAYSKTSVNGSGGAFNFTLGGAVGLNAGPYRSVDIVLIGVRADGSQVTVASFTQFVATTGTYNYMMESWTTPPVPAGATPSVMMLDNGFVDTAAYLNGRVLVLSTYLGSANSSFSYVALSGQVPTGAGSNTTYVTSSSTTGTTNLTLQEVLSTAEAATIGTGGLRLAYRVATSGVTFTNDVAVPVTTTAGTYSTTLSGLAAGLYDLKFYYYDTQGREVDVIWRRVSTGSAGPVSFGGYSTVILGSESGTVSRDANNVLSITPGVYTGLVNVPPLLGTSALAVSASGNAGGAQTTDGRATGYFTQSTYNGLNYKTSSNEGDGLYRQYGTDANGHVVQTDLYGRQGGVAITTYTAVDARGRTLAQFDPLVKAPDGTMQRPVTRYTYDVLNNVLTKTDALKNIWQYQYNAYGTQIKAIDPLTNVTQTEVDQFGRVTILVSALNNVSYKYYDLAGRLTAEVDPFVQSGNSYYSGEETSYTYDPFDRKISQTDPNGNGTATVGDHTTQFFYDNRDRLIEVEQAQGWHLAHDNNVIYVAERQRLIDASHPSGYAADATTLSNADQNALMVMYTSGYAYDGRNHRIAASTAPGQVTFQSYDGLGRVQTTKTLLNSALVLTGVLNYDAYGNVVLETDGDNGKKFSVYGGFGRIAKSIDQDGNETDYVYDDYGRETREYDPHGTKDIRKTYDDAGRLLTASDLATGVKTTYTYDLLGHQVTEVITTPVNASTGKTDNRNLSMKYDADGQLTYWKDTITGMNLNMRYDKEGNRIEAYTDVGWDPTGKNTANNPAYRYLDHVYAFDSARRVTQETDVVNGTVISAYSYDANGNRTAVNDGKAAWTYQYDANNRVIAGTAMVNGVFNVQNWTYDTRGNVLSYKNMTGSTVTYSTVSTYNEANLPVNVQTHTDGQPDQTTTTTYDNALRATTMTLTQGSNTFHYTYTYFGDGREKSIHADGPASGTSDSAYDVDKIRSSVGLGQTQYASFSGQNLGYKNFTADNEGHILSLYYDDGKEDPIPSGTPFAQIHDSIETREYVYVNGNPVGEIGVDTPANIVTGTPQVVLDDGTYNLDPLIDQTHPSSVLTYTIRGGDTLQSIASQVYGNPSLWYVIADANNLPTDTPLTAGMNITIPNTTTLAQITADNHAVYSESQLVGSTLPNLIQPPPPSPSWLQTFVTILIIALVAVVVAAVTFGVGGLIVGALGIAGTSAGAVAATVGVYAAVGSLAYAAGNALQQETLRAIHYQTTGFNWNEFDASFGVGALEGAAVGVGQVADAAAAADQLSTLGRVAAIGSEALLKGGGALVSEIAQSGKITSYTGIFGSALEGGLKAYVDTAPGVTNAPGTDAASSDAGQAADTAMSVVGDIRTIGRFVTPWVQLGETYLRYGKIKPPDVITAVAETGYAAVGDSQDDSFGARLRTAGMRLMTDSMTAGALSQYDGTFGSDGKQHLFSAEYLGGGVGQETGLLLAPYIGMLAGLYSHNNAPTPTRQYDQQKDTMIDPLTGNPIDPLLGINLPADMHDMSQVTMTRSGDGLSWGTDYGTPTITPSGNSDIAAWGNYGADQQAAESTGYLAQDTPINTGPGLLSDSNDPIARRAAELQANDPTLTWTDAMDKSNAEAQTNAADAAKQYQNAGITADEPAPDSVVGSNLPTTGNGYSQVPTPATAGSVAAHFVGSAFSTLLNSVSNGIADLYRIPNDLGNAADYIQADLEANVANAWQTGDWTHYQIGLTQAPIPQLTSSIAQAADQGVSLSDALANAIPGYSIANNLADAGTALSNGDYNGAADELGKGVGSVASLLVMEKAVNAGVFLAEGLGGLGGAAEVEAASGAPQLQESNPIRIAPYDVSAVVDNSTPAIEGVLEGTSPSTAQQPADVGMSQQQSNLSGDGEVPYTLPGKIPNAGGLNVNITSSGGSESGTLVIVIKHAAGNPDGPLEMGIARRDSHGDGQSHYDIAENLRPSGTDRLIGITEGAGHLLVRTTSADEIQPNHFNAAPTQSDAPVIRRALKAAGLTQPVMLRDWMTGGWVPLDEVPSSTSGGGGGDGPIEPGGSGGPPRRPYTTPVLRRIGPMRLDEMDAELGHPSPEPFGLLPAKGQTSESNWLWGTPLKYNVTYNGRTETLLAHGPFLATVNGRLTVLNKPWTMMESQNARMGFRDVSGDMGLSHSAIWYGSDQSLQETGLKWQIGGYDNIWYKAKGSIFAGNRALSEEGITGRALTFSAVKSGYSVPEYKDSLFNRFDFEYGTREPTATSRSDNGQTFKRLIQEGKTPEEAAFGTPTGKALQELGATRMEFDYRTLAMVAKHIRYSQPGSGFEDSYKGNPWLSLDEVHGSYHFNGPPPTFTPIEFSEYQSNLDTTLRQIAGWEMNLKFKIYPPGFE